jgi:UMF1 family MFS transporter
MEILDTVMSLNRKHIISWAFFVFANSSYSAFIAAVVFPVYYANTIVGNAGVWEISGGDGPFRSAWRSLP